MKKLCFLLFALLFLAGCQKNSTQADTAENAAASAEPVAVDAAATPADALAQDNVSATTEDEPEEPQEEQPQTFDEAYAVALTADGSDLQMKKSPESDEIVASIPYGHLVKIYNEKTEEKDTIDGITDYWYRAYCNLDYDKSYTGWVFGGHLSKILNAMPYEVYTQYKGCWDISYAVEIAQEPYDVILSGNDEHVAALFAFGILEINKMYESPDKTEAEYPAALAVRRSTPFVLKSLLLNGATLEQSNSEDNVLFLAAKKFNSEFARTCLKYAQADVNFVDKDGRTALYHAVKNRNYETARALMQYGADPNIGTETPFELAKDDVWFTNLLADYKEIYERNQKGFSMETRQWSDIEKTTIHKNDFTLNEIVEYNKDGSISYWFQIKDTDYFIERFYNGLNFKNKTLWDGEENSHEGELKKPVSVNFNDVENRWDNSWSNWETIKNDKGQIIKYVRDDNLMQLMEYDEKGNILWVDGYGFDEYYENEYYDNGQLKRISRYRYGYNTGDL
ncbi:MAG: ankyrin repeat domain-containing protein [Spirochaetaceae bacterium]|nr:ankyrin repeat domain-containing protein [Spirochaetaceae bacterium]